MENNRNKSEVTDKELENELERVKNELLKEDCGTIEVPVEIVKLARDILDGYVRSTEETLSEGRHLKLDEDLDETTKLLLQSIHTCVNTFNELLDE